MSLPTVLIADDEPSFHTTISPHLEEHYHLRHAYNGWQTLEEIENNSIDIVILDLNMNCRHQQFMFNRD